MVLLSAGEWFVNMVATNNTIEVKHASTVVCTHVSRLLSLLSTMQPCGLASPQMGQAHIESHATPYKHISGLWVHETLLLTVISAYAYTPDFKTFYLIFFTGNQISRFWLSTSSSSWLSQICVPDHDGLLVRNQYMCTLHEIVSVGLRQPH